MSDPGAQRKCVARELEKFVVETRAVHAIRVPHRVHGHRYTFRTEEKPSPRILRAGLVRGNEKAAMPSSA